ncbi:MAG TPA: hypothetical protein VL283_03240, partial [Candidatus Baltobacteraceae bacterium]|nr:hypothetical protein [Candidatus Baltobacteraceae bacterium]
MERWMSVVVLLSSLAAVIVGKVLVDRFILRRAEKRHRAEIEAFAAWFLYCVVPYDREAISDIGRDWTRGVEHAYVYLKDGGWFEVGLRSPDGSGGFSISIFNVSGRSLGRFPPHGLRCRAPWFTKAMGELQELLDAWPREWTGSERARR